MPAAATDTAALLTELRAARIQSDRLFEIIRPGNLYDRPIDARHRVIFYVGHLDGFDSIQICREGLGVQPFAPGLDALFQAGIDPDSGHLPTDQPSDWPDPESVSQYVARSREHVDKHLEHASPDVLYMALEHRLMHLETLAYMFHNLPYASKLAPGNIKRQSGTDNAPIPNKFCTVMDGRAVLGKAHDEHFGWDNEFDQNFVSVPAFRLQRYPVSNREYLEFVQAGAAVPHFWSKRDGMFFWRGMFSEYPLPPDGPAYVSYAEASAYAAWRGYSLPSEPQFHRAAYGTPAGDTRPFPWGKAPPEQMAGNFDLRAWDPEAVTASTETESAWGIGQLVGNGWEWTNTPFSPFPGFQPRDSYPGYSANFFDGEHFVLKGGSPRTAARLLRASFRNWFRRDYPYVYAKFRCCQN